jgi:hypothetical protein
MKIVAADVLITAPGRNYVTLKGRTGAAARSP